MNSIRDLLQIAAFAMFCIPLNSCSKDEELVYDNTNLKNNYQIAFKEVESIHEDELQVITGEYSKSLAGDFGLITKEGLTEECDKEVVLACKDAECRLNDVSFKGNYTIEAVRLAKGKEKLIYSKTFSSTNATKLLEQQLVWEQGRFTTAGAKASNNNVIRTAVPIIVSQGEKYTFEAAGNTTTLGFYYDSNGKLVSPCFTIGGGTITIPNGVFYMHISYRSVKSIDVSFAETFKMYQIMENNNIQLPMGEKLLTIIDDDSNIRYYTDIYPVAKVKKVSISSAVIAGRIGQVNNYMTWDNINDAYCNGMEMLCHTYSHPLTTDKGWPYNLEYFEEDYRKACNNLKAHGIVPNLLVFSGSSGRYDICQEACKRASFDGAFLAGDNRISFGETDRYKIPRFRIGNDSNYHWELPLLKGMINKLSSSGGWMVWMMHTSSKKGWAGGTEEGSSAWMLGEIIDYARAHDIKIVTADYGFKKMYMNNLQ
jgi:peptidoglycan/xylan/chitin deacetylase (PgdA/CDA1 family)